MRKLAYLVGLFALVGLPTVAQESRSKDLSLEYSYIRWYGIAGEFGDYHVGQFGGTSVDTNLITYMAGPRFYFHNFGRFTPFAQELFGAAHSSSAGFGIPGSRNSFAMALGAGVDVPLKSHWSVRLGPVDYLLTEFPETTAAAGRKTQNNLRVSGGVRWRF